ncbi:hypothetical protein LTS08_001018 [Lithohypha guttulata]|nr:hypothetical protein LTS08_001018 [Lithohypha guttulata]
MPLPPQATFWDKLKFFTLIPRVLAAGLSRLILRPFSRGLLPDSLFKDIAFSAVRTNLALISTAQEQWLNKTTEGAYLEFMKSKSLKPDTDVLNVGLKIHWLGSKNAKKTMLYFHGGGYVLAMSPGHLQFLADIQRDVGDVGIAIVEYTLAPMGQYPVQLRQAAESLDWLLTKQGKRPGEIILAGDSAGANLALALISHMLHPHPTVINKPELSEPLASAILISPWVNFANTDPSIRQNVMSDFISEPSLERWSKLFLGSSQIDNYNTPSQADSTWFKGIDEKVKDILIWGGGGEVLIDSIELIAQTLKAAHRQTEYVVEPGKSHEDFIVLKLLGYSEKAEGTQLIENWIKARL